ncbi:MAG: hypothetical protein IID59_01145 [Proteobacteria bacterium]|nr:hypothetical protein [Pseudomonadota bacterium]
MLRNIAGAIIGIAVAVLTVKFVEWFSHSLYPFPDGLEITDTEALNAHIGSLPLTAFLLVLAGNLIATFDGVITACLIGRIRPFFYALLIGMLMIAATASNLLMFRHPNWYAAAVLIGIVLSAWLAMIFAGKLRARRTSGQ